MKIKKIKYKEWKKLMEELLYFQELRIKILKELNNEINTDELILKSIYLNKLQNLYDSYIENKLILKIVEREKNKFSYGISNDGLPVIIPKYTYKKIKKYFPNCFKCKYGL